MNRRNAKPELERPRVTYHAAGRTFDRLLKEESLQDAKNVVRLKLDLEPDAIITFQQLRDGSVVDLDDDDDFEAFCALAYERRAMEVKVTVASLREISRKVVSKKRSRSKTPMRRSPSPVEPPPSHSEKDSDDLHARKKRKVTFESHDARLDPLEGDGHRSKSRKHNSGYIADAGNPAASDEQRGNPMISVPENLSETETPQRGRKRSKSIAGLPVEDHVVAAELPGDEETSRKNKKKPKSTADSEHPKETEISLTSKKRSKSKSRQSPSRTRPETTTVPTMSHDLAQDLPDIHLEHGPANNAKSAHSSTEVPENSSGPVTKLPAKSRSPTTSRRSKRMQAPVSVDPEASGLQNGGTRTVETGPDVPGNPILENNDLAPKPRNSGKKKTRKATTENDAVSEELPKLNEELTSNNKRERPMTEKDKEIMNNIFSKAFAKYSSTTTEQGKPQHDATPAQKPTSKRDDVQRTKSPLHTDAILSPPATVSEPSVDSETFVARTLIDNASPPSLPESTPPSRSTSVVTRSSKSSRPALVAPCPVCQKTPFHLRYKCPVVIAGPDAIRKRLEELKKKDTGKHHDLIAELERMVTSRRGTGQGTRTSNVNSDSVSSSVSGPPKQQTGSDTSDASADHSSPMTSTSKNVENRKSREVEAASNSSSESEATILPTTRDRPPPKTSLSFANVNLQEIIRGPVGPRHSIDEIINAVVDEEDVDDDDVGGVALDEEDEDQEHDNKRLARQLAKELPSSDGEEEEETDDDESVVDIQAITGAQQPEHTKDLSFQAMDKDDTTSDVDEQSSGFTEGLAAVLNGIGQAGKETTVDQSEPKLDVAGSSPPTRLDNESRHPSQKRDAQPAASKSTTNQATPTITTIDAGRPRDKATHSSPPTNDNPLPAVEDEDPIEPAEEFPVVQNTSRKPPSIVGRMRPRNGTKTDLPGVTRATRLKTSLPKKKGGPGAQDVSGDDAGSQQATTTVTPDPPDPIEEARSLPTTRKAGRPTAEKSDPKAKTLTSKADALAQAVAEKGLRRTTRKTGRPVVVIPPAPPRRAASHPPPPSLDKWATLSVHDDDSIADELHSSSQVEQGAAAAAAENNVTGDISASIPEQPSGEAGGGSQNPLFLPSDSQLPFPYSQWKNGTTQEEPPAKHTEVLEVSSDSDEKKAKPKTPMRRRSSVSYRSLTDLAKQKTLFPPFSSPAQQRVPINRRLDKAAWRKELAQEEEESDSDSSDDANDSHIPKARLAGANMRSQKGL